MRAVLLFAAVTVTLSLLAQPTITTRAEGENYKICRTNIIFYYSKIKIMFRWGGIGEKQEKPRSYKL